MLFTKRSVCGYLRCANGCRNVPMNTQYKTRNPKNLPNTILRIAVRTILPLLLVASGAVAQSARPVPTDLEIRKILEERVEKYRQSPGIVVGVIEPSGRRIVAYGK